ncbi:MAG TPA: DSD1 family PLP-dependent enzyme [Acidimicrobiales bacterium]|jgi:D-serine deaminase-like pyridoxal phosphate-dependent protein|nr:DSD1 family PLP-dependent enzyme [Acidimicrobiales bacterium]
MDESRRDQPRYDALRDRLGDKGSRAYLTTPALVCDYDLLVENVSSMAAMTTRSGVALRPHVKSHKSAYVARLQLEAGAAGLAFAKLSEAEAVVAGLAREGTPARVSALLTSPLVGHALARRAIDLSRLCDLSVVVDCTDGVDELDEAASTADVQLTVLCDVDVGLGRTGVASSSDALRVVERITSTSHLRFGGVQGYAGHLQHVAGRDERRAASIESTDVLRRVVKALESHGHDVALRTGGGTGTSQIDVELGLLNELQCGSYVFMDREYRDALGDDVEGRFAQSLFIEATVVSDNHERFVTVDAGLKAMATDAGVPLIAGHEGEVSYQFFGDEHGMVTRGAHDPFRRGDRLTLVPPHCDPTVDKYDVIWFVRGDVVLDVMDVDARGCSQ